MYQVFLGFTPLPIAPSKITTTVNSRNQTVELIDGREVSILKDKALTEIAFDFMLPHQKYPFTTLAGAISDAINAFIPSNLDYASETTGMLAYLEKLKTDKEPFYLVIIRTGEGGGSALSSISNMVHSYNSCIKVTLESYTIEEDAEAHGLDVMVSVVLKQYEGYTHTTLFNDVLGVIKKVRG